MLTDEEPVLSILATLAGLGLLLKAISRVTYGKTLLSLWERRVGVVRAYLPQFAGAEPNFLPALVMAAS